MKDYIIVKGAKGHNLKNLDVKIPRNKLVVLTGLSGSGKSSLAFDTIFAEGQRRYMESLSSYARQFLGQMEKPDVEYIEGLSPAISIDQKTTSHNPRSTVGTVTEIYDYLRLLYARVGTVHCPNCGKIIERQTIDKICDKIKEFGEGTKIMIMSPVIRGRKGEYTKKFEQFRKSGFVRVEVDGSVYSLAEDITLDKNIKHNISVVVDRLIVKEGFEKRLYDSLETAIKLSEGLVEVDKEGTKLLYSTKYACPDCDISIEEVEPRLFSFNTPYGACPTCTGLGFKKTIDPDLIIPNKELSLKEGAIKGNGWGLDSAKMSEMYFSALSKRYNFSLNTKIKDLPEDIVNMLLYGNNGEIIEMNYSGYRLSGSMKARYEGVIPNLMRRYSESTSDFVKEEIEKYMEIEACPDCNGKKLKKEALAVTIGNINISEMTDMSVSHLLEFFNKLELTENQKIIAERVNKEIVARLNFLKNVGLDYLTLSRSAISLSGGEAQRIRLATQIGSGLTGVLYILDEPSIGLHQRDNDKLLATLKKLRDLGNTLIVVEHDDATMKESDYIIDIGPGAGIHGGEVVFSGTYDEILKCENSLTGQYLSGKKKIDVPKKRKIEKERFIEIIGAKQNNLKNVSVKIPVGVFTTITGVSGSGKSSLINETLYPYLATTLNRAKMHYGNFDKIKGLEYFDKVINIDQSPIGRTPRSNPATYTGVFNAIRELFAATADAKERGYKAGRFSFNVSGGRCENCQGGGIIKIEMHFLPDVFVPCEVCKGARYNRETLNVLYKGKNISEVLEMTVDEACEFFKDIPSIYGKIYTLQEVGLGYIRLGQSATTLSGGEAQRVKLATELSKRSTGKTVYILDEPTTGLHIDDVSKLIKMLQKLVDNGNTVITIEHNLDVIKVSDYIIDIGKEGGDKGGEIVAFGTPEEVADVEESYTGQYLKNILNSSF